jgi:ABC-type transport system involved in cytochrome c biogenesis permease subunit
MTEAAWEQLSDQAVAMCGIVYFLALLAHLVEWSLLRTVPVDAPKRVSVGTSAPAGPPTPASADHRPDRVAMFGRLGVLLTIIAVAVHFVAMFSRGMAADPNRVPWGNMYEFTMTGTFVVAFVYLVLYQRFKLSWLSPLVLTFVLAILMLDVIWLHERVAPLTEALSSYWLVIHVVSAIIATGAFTLGGMTSFLYLVK